MNRPPNSSQPPSHNLAQKPPTDHHHNTSTAITHHHQHHAHLPCGSNDTISVAAVDDNAISDVDVRPCSGGGDLMVADGLVGVTTWFHAGASGKVSTASVSLSSQAPRGYCPKQQRCLSKCVFCLYTSCSTQYMAFTFSFSLSLSFHTC